VAPHIARAAKSSARGSQTRRRAYHRCASAGDHIDAVLAGGIGAALLAL
jgi:hypothetical protein